MLCVDGDDNEDDYNAVAADGDNDDDYKIDDDADKSYTERVYDSNI